MRNILLIGAAALAFGAASTAPALANCSLTSAHQEQCALNLGLFTWGHKGDQDIDQWQGGKLKKGGKGTIQRQNALNFSLFTHNQDQSIKQGQWIKSKGQVHGETTWGPWTLGSPTQVQNAANVAVGSGGDQSIDQYQSFENNTYNTISGTMQEQTAVNVAVGSDNDQSITQHQSLQIGY